LHYPLNEVLRQSAECRHVAFSVAEGSNAVVYLDGIPSQPYDDAGMVAFGPGDEDLAYIASRSNKWFVVVNGREGKRYDRIGYPKEGVWPFTFSSQGGHLAYIAAQGNTERVVVDDREEPAYDQILVPAPVFSPDSKQVAYFARRGSKVIAVADSRERAEGDDTMRTEFGRQPSGLWFSPNGKRFACAVKRTGKWFVVIDGKESQPWDGISSGFGHGFPRGDFVGVRFSPDSKHYVYEALQGDGYSPESSYSVVLDGKVKARGHFVGCFLFSPDSKRTAYVQLVPTGNKDDWNTVVVVDDLMDKPFDGSVEQMEFSPDSKQLVYKARRGHIVEYGSEFIVINGKAGSEYDDVSDFSWNPAVFNPGGGQLAYVGTRKHFAHAPLKWLESKIGRNLGADREMSFVVIGNHERRIPEKLDTSGPSFTKGKRWGYFLHEANDKLPTECTEIVFVDGEQIGSYGPDNAAWRKEISFSPDSRHFAFQAYRGSWHGVLVVDGRERDIGGEWLLDSGLVFDSSSHLHGLILRDKQIIRIEVDLTALR
jgi:hypothetical protein